MIERKRDEDDIPRQSFFELLPKRSVLKIFVLLAMLVTIIVLQRRTGSVAGCVANTFVAPRTEGAPRIRLPETQPSSRPSPPSSPSAPLNQQQ